MLGVTEWIRIAAIVFVVMLFPLGYLKGCSDEKEKYEEFKAQVEAAGKAQEQRTAAIKAHDELLKEEADEENRLARDRLLATIGKLRRERSDSSFVPAAPADSRRPDLICFDRAEYQRTDGIFTAGARGLADEGAAATVDLDSAKLWAGGSR